MKIGIDARFWNETGVGRYIRNLVTELQIIDQDNDYVLFVLSKDYEQVKFQISNLKFNIRTVDIHWHSIKEQKDFPSIITKENLDLMHFPYFSIPILYKRPYVVTIHDLILHHFPTGEATTLPKPVYFLKMGGYKYIISQAAKHAEKIIAVSQATKDEIVDHLHVKPSKIDVVYEGIDPLIKDHHKGTTFKEGSQRPKTEDQKYGKYFLHIGNVYPHKNAERLVDAFGKANVPDTRLIFVGKKDYFMSKLEQRVKKQELQDRILFTGFVTDEELAGLLKHSLATVVPSLMEGFGLPVIEAFAQNSLVIASDIPSLREVAKDAALFVDPFNIDDISAKMQTVASADPEEFESLRKKGLAIARGFSWEKMARETLKIYESSVSIRQSQ
ncbi:MAG: glycosyltransferase family 1 protein [Patescibacteria group bacterium]